MSWLGSDRDPNLGGAARRFPSTCWSRILDDAPQGPEGRRASGEELAQGHWKPVYALIRRPRAKANEDGKGLTPRFCSWMLQSGFLEAVDPARGRFRSFVKVALRNWLIKEQEKAGTLKRGGGRVAALDEVLSDGTDIPVPSDAGLSPEQALDEVWRNELLRRAMSRMEELYRREGKEDYYRVF